MSKTIKRTLICRICFLFFLFLPCSSSISFAAPLVMPTTETSITSDKEIYETLEQSSKSNSVFDKKSIFEDDESSFFEKTDDDKLNAPPTFPDDGEYNPGGQVNPALALNNESSFLLFLFLVYMVGRFIFLNQKNRKSKIYK